MDDDDYEYREASMSDNDYNNKYTIDIKGTLIGFLPNLLTIGLTLYFMFICARIISKFTDPSLQIMGMIIMSYAALKIFPTLVFYKLMYKKREEVTHLSFEGNNKVLNYKKDK